MLDLGENEITSIGKRDFETLSTLTSLSLSQNHILEVEDGTFELLPELRELYFRENEYTNIEGMFGNGGQRLQHLGLQKLKLSCLPGSMFARFPRLRWIYINHSLPIFVDWGSFRALSEDIVKVPVKASLFAEYLTDAAMCDDIYDNLHDE